MHICILAFCILAMKICISALIKTFFYIGKTSLLNHVIPGLPCQINSDESLSCVRDDGLTASLLTEELKKERAPLLIDQPPEMKLVENLLDGLSEGILKRTFHNRDPKPVASGLLINWGNYTELDYYRALFSKSGTIQSRLK
jgi:hypothetical protein